jgi:hypothetical protein
MKKKTEITRKISKEALRRFADNMRIAHKAVQNAIEENKRLGISEDMLNSKHSPQQRI